MGKSMYTEGAEDIAGNKCPGSPHVLTRVLKILRKIPFGRNSVNILQN